MSWGRWKWQGISCVSRRAHNTCGLWKFATKRQTFCLFKEKGDCKKLFEYKLLKCFQADGLCNFSKLLKKCFEVEIYGLDEAFYINLRVLCLSFISAHKVPWFKQKLVFYSVILDWTDQSFLHHVTQYIATTTVMQESLMQSWLKRMKSTIHLSLAKKWFCSLYVYSCTKW